MLEFFIVGLVLGVLEDIIAIKAATNAPITLHVFKVAFAVALPFAIFSELIVDHPRFWNFLREKRQHGGALNAPKREDER